MEKKQKILIVSGIFNVLLISSVYYLLTYEPASSIAIELVKEKKEELPQWMRRSKSYEELLQALHSDEQSVWGFKERDFALTELVDRHFFSLDEALERENSRRLFVSELGLALIPPLDDVEREKVQNYLSKNPFPFRTEGLFLLLKAGNKEQSLREAFFKTKEFQALLSLYQNKKEELLDMLVDGSYSELLAALQLKQSGANDSGKRILAYYYSLGSNHVKPLLPPKAKKAATVKEKSEEVALLPPKKKCLPSIREARYVVQEGDSLWKIARLYNVDVGAIKSLNRLTSDDVKPGKIIKIPAGK